MTVQNRGETVIPWRGADSDKVDDWMFHLQYCGATASYHCDCRRLTGLLERHSTAEYHVRFSEWKKHRNHAHLQKQLSCTTLTIYDTTVSQQLELFAVQCIRELPKLCVKIRPDS